MDKTFFNGLSIKQVELSTGARGSLPVRYYDWSMIMAHFPVPAAAVRRLLPTNKLKLAELVPGTAVVSFAAMEYRQIADVAPYNEFAIMVPVLYQPTVNIPGLPLLFPHWFKHFGLYVYRLPVTTQEACDGGIELWGYPKFIAQISFEETNNVQRHVRAEGKDIVSLEVKKMATKARAINYYSYTVKDGKLLRTLIQTQGQYGIPAWLRGGASYRLGDHPIAEELRALRIVENAVKRIYAPQVQSILHPASERLPLS